MTLIKLLWYIISQCHRSTITVGQLYHTVRAILESCLENTFETLQGESTISVAAAAAKINKVSRAVKHTINFLATGEIALESRRGGKRNGRSLLDCEVFKERASLWLKTQTVLYTSRRLRATRKKGSKSFKTQVNLPIQEKKHKVLLCVHLFIYCKKSYTYIFIVVLCR